MGSRLDATSSAVRKRIQNHSFEDEEGEEYGASAFGGHGDYMRRKKAKLQNLDNEIRSSAAQHNCPQIFRSVVAHVNGYTQPSLQDLHRLIVRHGGGFLQYLDGKTAATHIIASSLTPKKRDELRRYRVVKPAWVVESVEAGRLLPWDLYKVVDEGQNQKILNFDNGRMLSQAATPKPSYKDESKSSWYSARFQAEKFRNDESLDTPEALAPNQSNVASQSDYGEFPSFTSLDAPANDSGPNKPPVANEQEDGLPESPTAPTASRNKTAIADAVSPHRDPAPPKPEMTSEEYNAQLLSDPRMKNSSVGNPEFLQQYYRESRLHHLSTWKAELKAQLQSKAQEKSRSQSARKKLVPGARRYIMHVDFDCFFAAVSTLQHPELEGKPVAIAHGTGTGSEIASCNYVARASGVKNGMWMKGALQACPDLRVLPYDFPAYEEASRKFYRAILAVDGIVQSVSIDEALVDITSLCLEAGGSDGKGVSEGSIYREQAKADEIAEALRATVKGDTGCAVSVGIGGNILQAKVALRKAKPAGQFQLKPDAVLDFIAELPVQSLPGVGYSLSSKMEELGVKLVKDIRELSREKLTSALGPKTGIKLWDYARGIDRTEVGNEVVRKSVSAEVNWGIRFVTQEQADDFVRSLCEELHRRLVENLVKGKQLTLKVMRRALDAPLEPVKHLGHGKCDVFNKSVILGIATNAADSLGKEAVSMLQSLKISPGDLRGLGVQMTKLEPIKSTSEKPDGSQKQLTFKAPPARKTAQHPEDPDLLDSPRKNEAETVWHGPSLNDSTQKPLNISGTQFIMPSQPDPAVVAALPRDIRSKLVAQAKPRSDSRTGSPLAPTRAQPNSSLPPQSQLDPDILAALPKDVLAEVLGYYDQPAAVSSRPTTSSSTLPPPRPSSSSSNPLRVRKPISPPKKRRGRPPLKQPTASSLTQSKFVIPRPDPTINAADEPLEDDPNISGEFLAALPEDIRREVLEESKRTRLLQRRAAAAKISLSRPGTTSRAQINERHIRLPPLPERPTFTSKRLSQLTDLRDEASAWHTAFAEEGPFAEDVTALADYLKHVVADERDLDKAVSVVKWLAWLVEDGKSSSGGLGSGTGSDSSPRSSPGGTGLSSGSQSGISWDEALTVLKEGVQQGLEERGLPAVDFAED
ncbi:Putative Deoxycytidyl transferase (Eurofung) [Aspergillus calidoustus]|uniref:DNA repair protein REV1 n=1 Tax=Aspergillus calidoustus TaxID=454130 RepID=A0A0U5CQT2_ASPCI|nr:Putative Deoxycytidyl transferase (Eurofung) [Aspergillus calidoustus]